LIKANDFADAQPQRQASNSARTTSTDVMDPLVLEQRIRNRLIEYVEWVVEYQAESEPRLGMGELLNQWEDFITRPICEANFPSPVFSADEIQSLKRLDDGWERLCSATPKHVIHDSEVFKMSEWEAFVACAAEAALTFHGRGKLPEGMSTQVSA
jgi:hypothetical protein